MKTWSGMKLRRQILFAAIVLAPFCCLSFVDLLFPEGDKTLGSLRLGAIHSGEPPTPEKLADISHVTLPFISLKLCVKNGRLFDDKNGVLGENLEKWISDSGFAWKSKNLAACRQCLQCLQCALM